jgi:hypothetical protein
MNEAADLLEAEDDAVAVGEVSAFLIVMAVTCDVDRW